MVDAHGPQTAIAPLAGAGQSLKRVSRWANRRLVVPVLRVPLVHEWVGSPLVGYLAVLTTTGRHSGRPRHTPVNYAIHDGGVYLVAWYGLRSDWYRDLLEDPQVTLRLPGRRIEGVARAVSEAQEAEDAALHVAANSGLVLVTEGMNPFAPDEHRLRALFAGLPVVRVDAQGPSPGQTVRVEPEWHDPGSPWWVLAHVVVPSAVGLGFAVGWLRRRSRRE